MDEETTVAQGLRVTDESAGYDDACKRILSEKAILARIMKACLEEYKDCNVDDIAGKYIRTSRSIYCPSAAGRGEQHNQRYGHRRQVDARGDNLL